MECDASREAEHFDPVNWVEFATLVEVVQEAVRSADCSDNYTSVRTDLNHFQIMLRKRYRPYIIDDEW